MQKTLGETGLLFETINRNMYFIACGVLIALSPIATAKVYNHPNCSLNYPETDIKRLFPQSTRYEVNDVVPARISLSVNKKKIRMPVMDLIATRLGSKLDSEFETALSPLTFYTAHNSKGLLGVVLGTNVRIETGMMQLFVVYDSSLKRVKNLYIQKMDSKDAPYFRAFTYRKQFLGASYNSFPEDALILPPMKDPPPQTLRDHHAFVRAIKYNMLLMEYVYEGLN